jgi:hypothetical protein
MDKALCKASEQIGRQPRFIFSTSLKLAIDALPGTARDAANWVKLNRPAYFDAFDAALPGHTLFPAVRMLQGDKGARGLIAARKVILELPGARPRLSSTSIQERISTCFTAFDRRETYAATPAKFFSGTRLA